MKTHYSIAELHELELDGLPTSRRGLEKYVLAHSLKYREVPSRGKGGTRKEYELSSELTNLISLREIKNEVNVPVAVYQVSGEYSMLKAAAEKGWLDHDAVMMEQITAIKRAGASMIASYFAKDVVKIIS